MATGGPTPEALKEQERATWSNASVGWRTHDRTLVALGQPVTDELVRRAGVTEGMRVLDLASGTGEPSLSVAQRVGPRGMVVGIDLAEPMLAFAREKARQRGLTNVEYRVGDAETIELPESSFDAATMRWGIMFLPDPVGAMRAVHRTLRPGGTVALATWGPPEQNEFLKIPMDALRRHLEIPAPPPGAPGIFAFADPHRLATTLASAGFTRVGTVSLPLGVSQFASGADYWAFQRAIAGPILRLYNTLPPEQQTAVDAEVAQAAEKFRGPAGLSIPALAHIGWGTR